jgi:hypothetical protein
MKDISTVEDPNAEKTSWKVAKKQSRGFPGLEIAYELLMTLQPSSLRSVFGALYLYLPQSEASKVL